MAEVVRPGPVLVTGAGSFVARAFQVAADRAGFRLVALQRSDLDVTDRDAVGSCLERLAPSAVLNCAAFNDNDRAELDPAPAWRINRDGPANLASACAAAGAWLVHLSTDSVFGDIDTDAGHLETAVPAPVSVYGKSKLAGEQAVRERLREHVVLRLTWQFGPGDRAFIGAVARRALHEPEVRIATGQRGCPTPVTRTAEALLALLRIIVAGRGVPGTYHFCSAGVVTRMELAELVVAALRECARPRVQRLLPVPAAELDRARRPRCSVLDCRRFTALTGLARPPWREELCASVRAIAAERGVTPVEEAAAAGALRE